MEVKLKVLGGSNAGREIKIPGNTFIIGRGEGCHLRPKSDLISRQHCTILIQGQTVTVVDDSKNGTFVNEEKVDGRREVQPGDKLRLGQLQFEIVIGTSLAAAKKPKVKDVKDAAVRTVQASGNSDVDVMTWLEDEQDEIADTRRVYMADTAQIMKAAADSEKPVDPNATVGDDSSRGTKKKEYGKLPTGPAAAQPVDSRQAAADTLKKLFKGR